MSGQFWLSTGLGTAGPQLPWIPTIQRIVSGQLRLSTGLSTVRLQLPRIANHYRLLQLPQVSTPVCLWLWLRTRHRKFASYVETIRPSSRLAARLNHQPLKPRKYRPPLFVCLSRLVRVPNRGELSLSLRCLFRVSAFVISLCLFPCLCPSL